MKLPYDIYIQLVWNLKSNIYETGGLLGGTNEQILRICFDKCKLITDSYSYIPNTEYLNQQLAIWSNEGINFLGMFHSHISGGLEPSVEDLLYFEALLRVFNKPLFFIIVSPKIGLELYRVKIENNQLVTELEKIEIV